MKVFSYLSDLDLTYYNGIIIPEILGFWKHSSNTWE